MNAPMVNTVTGSISVDELGPTLMHEHLLIGFAGWESDTLVRIPKREQIIEQCCVRVRDIQALGVKSLLDPCPNDLGRDVVLAAEVAERTGFNIICATGLYKHDQGGASYWMTRHALMPIIDRLTEMFIRELTEGIRNTGIKAGIIKVATGNGVITDYEKVVMEAAARASLETGAPITTHTEAGTMGDEQQKILMGHGIEPHKIIIGHSCGSTDHDYHMNILENGSYLGFDRFGIDLLMPDEMRIKSLVALLKKNKESQIVVSHDSCWCFLGEPFPMELLASADPERLFNPTHFHKNIIPVLLENGVTQEQIDMMLIENPRRYFAQDPLR